MSDDPFGRPTRPEDAFGNPGGGRPRRRGWIRLVVGVLLALVGIAGVVGGIAKAVGDSARIDDDAVARGVVREVRWPDPVSFVVPDGDRRDYTVYLRLGGVVTDSDDQSLVASDTACVVRLPNAEQTGFSGARQGVSVTLGASVSVGHFSSRPGRVRLSCVLNRGTPRSRAVRGDGVPFVVTAGRPSGAIGGVVAIFAGIVVLLLGGGLAVWGLVATRRGR